MLSQLILLRHGETEFPGRYVGSTDVSLSDKGEGQVEHIRPLLKKEGVDHVFCSPMLRCRESLRILNLQIDYTVDEDLREIDFGEWEGKDFSEISLSHPGIVQEWAAGKDDFCFPAGECLTDFIFRLERFKRRVFAQEKKTILVVAHGGVIRHLICSFLGLPYEKYLLFRILEAKYTILDIYNDGGVLAGLNIGGRN